MKIFNHPGQGIKTIEEVFHLADTHRVIWNAEGLPAGVYFYRLTAGEKVVAGKMIKRWILLMMYVVKSIFTDQVYC